jgi:hypothetical protein
MRNRIASIVTTLPCVWALFVACATPISDTNLRETGTVDAQSLGAKMRCPSGATLVHGQTMGVESALWCEKPGGIKHGPFVDWYENHQKKTAGAYEEGLRTGPWNFFSPNGQLDTRITYERGAAISTETGPGPGPATNPPPAQAAPPAQAPVASPPAQAPAAPPAPPAAPAPLAPAKPRQ